jgi:histidine phosphotransfer protein HptB
MSQPKSFSQSPIDLVYLQQLSEGDTEFEIDLLEVYLEDCKLHLETIKTAIADLDYPTLSAEFHQLKGASGMVGALNLQELFRELEHKSKSQDCQLTSQIITDIEEGLVKVKQFFESHYA